MSTKVLNNLDLSQNQILNLRLQVLAADPGSPVSGQVWYNSSGGVIKYYDGTEIVVLGEAGGAGDADTLEGNNGAFYLARGNHTGAQAISTVTGLQTALDGKEDDGAAAAAISTHEGAADPHAGYLLESGFTKAAVDALNVDADTVDTFEAAQLLARGNHTGTQSHDTISDFDSEVGSIVQSAIDGLVDSAPGTLDTLNELAAALGDDPNFASTVTSALNDKVEQGDVDTSIAAKRYSTDVGNGSDTAITVTHSLGTRDVLVQVYDAASYDEVIVDNARTTTDTVTLTFATAPSSNAYRCVVIAA